MQTGPFVWIVPMGVEFLTAVGVLDIAPTFGRSADLAESLVNTKPTAMQIARLIIIVMSPLKAQKKSGPRGAC